MLGRLGFLLLATLATSAVIASVTSCSDATGTTSGGELAFDAAPAPENPCSGHTWSSLYGCYFGPSAQANCSRSGMSCHADEAQTGSLSSGFTCGKSQDECFKGVTAINSIVPSGGTASPETTLLYRALRKTVDAGDNGLIPMPDSKGSEFAFTPDDLQHIADWIKEGAQNN